ncbi:hypothetical protein [Glutamicibacter sp. NPDC087344]|uniref:hypothetical protein n=1 Tax=Glutamicibacter sp. NPDC087344 TaxID=3363994 RepID=UPI0037FCFB92
MQEKTLGDLIESARHSGGEKSLSYAALSKLCGGKPTAARLQQYVTDSLKNFPDPESIRNLAKGTGVSTREIILASARSLGLNIESDPMDLIFIDGISTLPKTAADSLRSIGRELVNLSRKADHAEAMEPKDTTRTKLRSVDSDGNHPGSQQKSDPAGGPVLGLLPWDANIDTSKAPPVDQIAAHPNFKSKRQKWEEKYGERGEESQDLGDHDG